MDINSIALIIVTAFINLAISNFVFLHYQKKIEESFAKKIYEYQVIYSRKTPKMLEVLETICQKYVKVVEASGRYSRSIPLYVEFKNKNLGNIDELF